MLVKHLEHKNVLKQTDKILDIIEVTTRLAEHSKAQSSTALMAAISDMVRHLSKNMQLLVSDVGPGDGMVMNDRYGKATDECLVQLSRKVSFPVNMFYQHNCIALFPFSYAYSCTLQIILHPPSM